MRIGRTVLGILMGLLLGPAAIALAGGPLASPSGTTAEGHPPFSAEVLDLARRIPVQDGGRVKPLSTYARFALLAANGKTTAKTSTDPKKAKKIGPTAWLLDCLFYPEIAEHYPVFRVQSSDALDDLGLTSVVRKKRDWYTYAELAPARNLLIKKARRYSKIDTKDRTAVQGQIVDLAGNFLRIESLLNFFDFFEQQGQGIQNATALALFPPPGTAKADPTWLTPATLNEDAAKDPKKYSAQIDLIQNLAELAAVRNDPARFQDRMTTYLEGVTSLARARGEYSKVPLEVFYYRFQPLFYAQWIFVLGFVLLTISWLMPRSKWLNRIIQGVLVLGLAFLVTAIVIRCIIRSRPPVSTLYETILFITATATLIALAVEWMNRQRIAILLAAVIGMGGLFLAGRYEVKEGVDTMPSLVAVLNTNYWLTLHVLSVTLGYAAGLLAAGIGHIYILGKIFGLKKNRPDFYRNVARMTFGVLCFGLIFSVVGTILGGVWANESWGRFWGWDPKENGALMIVLFELAILHARLGGHIRDFGLCNATVFGGIVIAFSWWGVNLLSVGLHSYGFTTGVLWNLLAYCAFEVLVVGAGIGYHLLKPTRVARTF